MSHRVSRRAVMSMLVGGTMALAAGNRAVAAPGVPIGAIHVTGRRTRTLTVLAPLVAEELATILGPRFAPGLKGGATLIVDLTQVILDDGDGGTGSFVLPFGQDSGSDQLEGNVVLVGPRREALAEFPMLATSGATYRSKLRAFPDPRRLKILARAFAWWTVGKLG
jgi:hypothetical protein